MSERISRKRQSRFLTAIGFVLVSLLIDSCNEGGDSINISSSSGSTSGVSSAPISDSTDVQQAFQQSIVANLNSNPNYVLTSADLQSLVDQGLISKSEQATLSALVAN
jgi:hypothetical protein